MTTKLSAAIGINHPEWAQLHRQVFGPETGPLVNWAEYTFDTV